MTKPFDPYRKWLGIPAQDQPPNHYRLLGIERFETDPDVISNAADGRMAQVKNYQAGKYSKHSQRILNELAAAKLCLLNPAKKADYDRQLREQDAEQAGQFTGPPPPRVADLIARPPVAAPDFPTFRPTRYRPPRRQKSSPWTVPLLLLAAGTLFVALVVFWSKFPH